MLVDMPNVYINAQDNKRETPITLALSKGHNEIAELLQSRLGPKDQIKKSKNKWDLLFSDDVKIIDKE